MFLIIFHMLPSLRFWAAGDSLGLDALSADVFPARAALLISIGALLGLVCACLLVSLPLALAQLRRARHERAERDERAAAARDHTRFLLLQEQARRRTQHAQMRHTVLHGVAAGLDAFCAQWDVAHSEEQEEADAPIREECPDNASGLAGGTSARCSSHGEVSNPQ